jgi:hypothetical protein
MDLLDLLLKLPEAIYWLVQAARFWRFGLSLVGAGMGISVLCYFVSDPAIRWIAGFHICAAVILMGALWETRNT